MNELFIASFIIPSFSQILADLRQVVFCFRSISEILDCQRTCSASHPTAEQKSVPFSESRSLANWSDHVFPDHLVKRDNALGGELWREGNGIAQSSNDRH